MRDLRSFTEFSFLLLNSLHLLKPAEEKLIFAVKGEIGYACTHTRVETLVLPPHLSMSHTTRSAYILIKKYICRVVLSERRIPILELKILYLF